MKKISIIICLLLIISCDKKKNISLNKQEKQTSLFNREHMYYTFNEHPIKSNTKFLKRAINKLEEIPFDININLDRSKADNVEWKLYVESDSKDSITLNGKVLKKRKDILITQNSNVLNYYSIEKGNNKMKVLIRCSNGIEYFLNRNLKVK